MEVLGRLLQGIEDLFGEIGSSLSSIGDELAYWVGQFAVSLGKELTPERLQEFLQAMFGAFFQPPFQSDDGL